MRAVDGPAYFCPRCGACFGEWKGMRLHIRKSTRCRSVFGDLDKTKYMQKRCRKVSVKASAAAGATMPLVESHSVCSSRPRNSSMTDERLATSIGAPSITAGTFSEGGDVEAGSSVGGVGGFPSLRPTVTGSVGIGVEIAGAKGRSLGLVV